MVASAATRTYRLISPTLPPGTFVVVRPSASINAKAKA